MSRLLSVCLLAGCEIISLLAVSHSPQSTSMEGARANVSKATIEGLVRDVACPIQNLDNHATSLHRPGIMVTRVLQPALLGDLWVT